VYCWATAPLTVTNSNPAVTVAVETRDAAIARIICTFMAYLPSRDPRRDVPPRAGVRVGSEFDLAANAASMNRHHFPRDSRRIPPISPGRAPERDITGTVIERVGSVAPEQLSVKARPVKPTLPALRSREVLAPIVPNVR
jgi:hypothetical protein